MRALAFVGHEDCRLMSRWGNEVTSRFPELVHFSGLRPGTVLDARTPNRISAPCSRVFT